MDYLQKIFLAFETHSSDGIRDCFENGIDPNREQNGKPLIYELINMYLRGPKFRDCIKVFVDYGVEFEDKALLAVLLDNEDLLESEIAEDDEIVAKTYSLDCTFTPLFEATLLHICAEYNHVNCARVLVKHGADVNTKAGFDEDGFGGQTPIFHTVNQNNNNSLEMLKFLVSQNADLDLTVKGLIWGKGYEWETFIPSVNPISYAMMGLLRQFQRTESQIYDVVSILQKERYGTDYSPTNVPNRYLNI